MMARAARGGKVRRRGAAIGGGESNAASHCSGCNTLASKAPSFARDTGPFDLFALAF